MPLVALDCDGVLVDYPPAYEIVWERAFGEKLVVVDPAAYHATNRYGVAFESRAHMLHFFSHFTDDVWESLPALPGAVEACHRLSAAGFDMAVVSAIDARVQPARLRNLRQHGFPIDRVIATGRSDQGHTKAAALNFLRPKVMVDDLADNFHGLSSDIHRALIFGVGRDVPNPGSAAAKPDTIHRNLTEFVDHWLSPRQVSLARS